MGVDGLVHRIDWESAPLSTEPLSFCKVLFVSGGGDRKVELPAYCEQPAGQGYATAVVSDAREINPLLTPDTIVVHIPFTARTKNDLFETVVKSCTSLIAAAQSLYQYSQSSRIPACKLFSLVTQDFGIADLGYAPLRGLARVLKTEIPAIFGGLFEVDQGNFPLSAIQHAQDFDVIRCHKGAAQIASLQPLQVDSIERAELRLNPDGSYLITGGTGGIGLETATWMAKHGARNIILVSRRGLPIAMGGRPEDRDTKELISRLAKLETLGTTVHVLAVDLGKPSADSILGHAIENLHIPPVKGVVHAAGIAAYHTLERCNPSDVAAVLAPKVIGSLNLDSLFPPGTLDFLIFTSSVGQLIGFPGQLSYASANAFLDELAMQRRRCGDKCTSILWTSWHGVGLMAESKSATQRMTKMMQVRGIGGVDKEEAFNAWELIANLQIDRVVVVRVLVHEADEPPRHPMLKNITPRKEEQPTITTKKPISYPKHSVAVVGMACRTAAGNTLDDFWQAIKTGKSMERKIDVERFPEANRKDTLWGNFLSEIDCFDDHFFQKSKRESSALDPHQRLLLQTTYHALESAGWFGAGQQREAESYDRTKGSSSTGCFIGMSAPDYALNLACHPPSPYTGFGMIRSFVAGYLSHHFGWTGPSHTIDTACSSAMVAIHQACRAIQAGECTQAVAGGVNLITNTALFEALRAGGFLSKTGACKTFDARADGYCRGEAVGVVILKPLSRAMSDGDDIQGVLLATGNNQNMNTTSITNPVLESQVALYTDVLTRAGVNPEELSYVEAHGTGTRAGDPVEVAGIRQVFGKMDKRSVLHIGSVKANIGHSEAASGVISLIKVLLMMRHGKLPPQAQFKSLNPRIPVLEPDGLAISASLKEWTDSLQLVLVNNFGASGNNAATVVAPPPSRLLSSPSLFEKREMLTASTSLWPIFISAASETSLATFCNIMKTWLGEALLKREYLPDLAFALAIRQNRQFQHVFCTTATSGGQNQAILIFRERIINYFSCCSK